MTIDTTFKAMTACAIQPLKAKMNDAANSTHLGVRITYDDLLVVCTIFWALLGNDGTIYLSGDLTLGGTDYQGWSGDNMYPFTFAGTQLGLTFI
ncbi:hypothetical protein [Mucilaginibacter sp.]